MYDNIEDPTIDPAPEAPKPKKRKRTYSKTPIKVLVDGKVFRGLSFTREGKVLILTTDKGTVYVNMEAATRPIEVQGQASAPPLNVQALGTVPTITGGMATMRSSSKNRQIEDMMRMPAGIEA